MRFLFSIAYSAGIGLYGFGIRIASAWNEKARKWIGGRKNIYSKIGSELKPGEYRVWFHCASAGEFEQGRPVIEAYRKRFPAHKIVLTFFSPSGYELRKNYDGADYIFYLPPDTSSNATRFIQLADPKLAVFVKYEFWFNFIIALEKKEIPAIIVSAIFREDHFIFGILMKPLKDALTRINKIFVQNEASLQLLKKNGFQNAELAGDTRFDRVWEIAASSKQIPLIREFKGTKKLFVGGSTWQPDEEMIINIMQRSAENWKFILVPHEINNSRLKTLEQSIKKNSSPPLQPVFYSSTAEREIPIEAQVLIVDKPGLLSSVYQYADIAYIGGGFGKGIHNTLEAAVYGIPVLFGAVYSKFPEANTLIKSGGAKSIKNSEELLNAVRFYERTENKHMAKSNISMVEKNTGATNIIMEYIDKINSGSAALQA